MCWVKKTLTNRVRRPVSGWTRTTGCSTGGKRGESSSTASGGIPSPKRRPPVVDGDEPVDLLLDPLGQAVVGGTGIGPQGVAAEGRHLHRPQHRAERRLGVPGEVGMPVVLDPAVDGVLGQGHHVGVDGRLPGHHVLEERVLLQLTPPLRRTSAAARG